MLNYLDEDKKIAYRFKNYYDPNHNKIKTVHSDGLKEIFEYDTKNKLIHYQFIDRENPENSFFEEYIRDYKSNTVKTVKSDDRYIITHFNLVMQPITIADSLGNITLYTYDELYRCIKIEDKKHNVEIFEYDRLGNLIYHRKEPILYEEWWRYDSLNNLVEYKNSNDIVEFYTWKNGLKVKEYNSYTDITKFFMYNDDYKLILSTDSNGKEDAYTYDKHGNLSKHEDEYYIKEYYYNSNDQLVEYIRKVK